MFDRYFEDWDVKSCFKKEFVSLWTAWLGNDRLSELDSVTEDEWKRFHDFILAISKVFSIQLANCDERKLVAIDDIDSVLADYKDSMEKDASQFSKFVIPELECVITEEWDYTYIIWYRDKSVLAQIDPFIQGSNLFRFS